jgi:hypothetical protein
MSGATAREALKTDRIIETAGKLIVRAVPPGLRGLSR